MVHSLKKALPRRNGRVRFHQPQAAARKAGAASGGSGSGNRPGNRLRKNPQMLGNKSGIPAEARFGPDSFCFESNR
jgi:hypothetical protein